MHEFACCEVGWQKGHAGCKNFQRMKTFSNLLKEKAIEVFGALNIPKNWIIEADRVLASGVRVDK
jgi:hypothetical protein